LVVLTSDHGEEFWDHALEEATLGGDPRRLWGVGHGHSMYEELLRVPLVIAGPGVPAARLASCPARQVDVMPTALQLLGLPGSRAARGRSLVAVSLADLAGTCAELPALAESPAYGPDSGAVIWKGRKLISRYGRGELLFDLRNDPAERHDLAPGQPSLAAGMRTILGRELAAAGRLRSADAAQLDEETRRELRALGYLK
jgi:arylsulfatase A-like enzyme